MSLRLGAVSTAFAVFALLARGLAAPPPAPCSAAAPSSFACEAALIARAQPYLWHRAGRAVPAAAGAVAAAAHPAAVVEVYHLRYEEVAADGLSRQVVERVFYVANDLGAQVFDSDDFWYDSSRWSFHLWRGTVQRAGGGAATIQDAGDDDPHGLGNRARGLTMPPLHAGDLIDVVYLLTPVAPASWSPLGHGYLGDLFAFRGAYPVERVTYVLCSRQPLAARGVGLPAAPAVAEPGGWTRRIWTAGPLPAFFSDADGPSITDSSPYVQTGSFRSWSDLAAWYRDRLAARAAITPEFRARLLRLVPPQPTALATVQAVWAYLAAHLDYEGIETGVHGFLPASPEQVFRDRAGDCKDGALLLATWLGAEGVPADVVLVRTWKMGGVVNGAATMAAFDHAIAYVPELNLWIDTTAPNLAVGELPASDQGSLALLVAPGQQGLRRIPIAAAAANATWRDVRLRPHGPDHWELQGSIVAGGSAGETWRRQLYAENEAAVAHWLRRFFPAARLLAARIDPGPGAVRIAFRALIRRRAFDRDATLFPDRYANLLAAERDRRDAKRIPVRWEITDRWSVPVARCPGPGSVAPPAVLASAFGSLQVERVCAAGLLATTMHLTQAATDVAAPDYPRFRGFWQAVDARLYRAAAPPVLARGEPPPALPAIASESK